MRMSHLLISLYILLLSAGMSAQIFGELPDVTIKNNSSQVFYTPAGDGPQPGPVPKPKPDPPPER